MVVTTAVKLPAELGPVLNVTVSEVALAVVTVPTALLLKATVLLAAVESNPKPLTVTVVALAAKLIVRLVMTGITVATCTAAPLATLLVVTVAVKLPARVGLVVNVTLSVVDVAEVTVPTAPLLKATELLPAVEPNPKPLMAMVEIFAARFAVLLVMTGTTVATLAEPEVLMLLVDTITYKSPAKVGEVEKVTVSDVAVAAVTVPTASPSKSTVLFAAVVSKPYPSMVSVAAPASRLDELDVMTGITLATWTAEALLTLLVVTCAVREPAVVGPVESDTVSDCIVAAVTVPTAPLLNTTVLLAAVVEKPEPLMVIVVAFAARLAVLLVTLGITVAT